jgi:predicted dehydrogenase
MGALCAAVAGLGFMGITHIEALRRMGVKGVGVLGIDRAEGQSASDRLGIPRVYGDIEELVSDPAVQVVHICTPNHLHAPMAMAALGAGKHVICEKPLAINSQESGQLTRLAAKSGLVAVVNHNLRYYPLCHEAHARVQSREIGDVRLVHGEYCQDWLFLPTDWNWRLEPELGGTARAVADIGSHWLDMITWITGLRVTAVMADLATMVPKRIKPAKEVETFAGKLTRAEGGEEVEVRTEDYAAVLLRLEGGARGSFLVSQVSAGRKNHFWWEVNGSKASLSWDQERPNELWLGHRERPNELLLKDPSLMHPDARRVAGYPGGHAEGYPDTFLQLNRAVYGYLREGDLSGPRQFPTFEDGHRMIRLCDDILASAREQRWVEISD